MSGSGTSYLPQHCQGRLWVIGACPKLPLVRSTAVCRADRLFAVDIEVARQAERACDFSPMLLRGGNRSIKEIINDQKYR